MEILRHKNFFVILLMMLYLFCSGTNQDTMKLVPDNKSDMSGIELSLKIAGQYQDISPDSAIYYYENALILARKFNHATLEKKAAQLLEKSIELTEGTETLVGYYNSLLAKIPHNKYKRRLHVFLAAGSYSFVHKLYDISLDLFLRARSLALEKGDMNTAGLVCKNISDIYSALNNSEQAFAYAFESLGCYPSIPETADRAFTLNLIGHLFWKMNANDSALIYYKRSYDIYSAINDTPGMAGELNNIGNVYRNISDMESAMEYYLQAYNFYRNIGDSIFIAGSAGNIGMIYAGMGQYDKSDDFYNQAMYIHKAISNWRGQILISNNMGHSSFVRKKYSQALDHLQNSLDIAIEYNSLNDLRDIYKYMSEVYEELKDYTNAFDYFSLYRQVKDSITDLSTAEEVNELGVKYFTNQMIRDNELLNREKKIQELRINKARVVRYFTIVISSLIVLILVIFYSRYRMRKKGARALEQKNRDLEAVVSSLEQSEKLLIRLNENKESLFKMITHDLRQPVKDLLAQTSEIAESHGKVTDKEFVSRLGRLKDFSVLIYSIFENLVTISAVQAGKISPEPGSHNLLSILYEALKSIPAQFDKCFTYNTLDFRDVSIYTDFGMAVKALKNILYSLCISNGGNPARISVEQANHSIKISVDYGLDIVIAEGLKDNSLQSLEREDGPEGKAGNTVGRIVDKKQKLDIYLALEYANLLGMKLCVDEAVGRKILRIEIITGNSPV